LGDDHGVGIFSEHFERFTDEGKWGNALDHIGDCVVDGFGPLETLDQNRVVGSLNFLLEGGIAQWEPGIDEISHGLGFGNFDLSLLNFASLAEQIEDHRQGWETVDTSPFAVEVDELGGFASVFGDRLEIPVLDNVGNEALFVLDFHGIEGTAVGVDTDEKFVFWFK